MEITLKGWKCERCGHAWVPVSTEKPRVCPKCKSPYWDTPRRSEVGAKSVREQKVREGKVR